MNDVRGRVAALSEKQRVLLSHWLTRPDHEAGEIASRKRLVAFVTPTGNPACDTGEIRQYLRDRLPDYMVPESVSMLESLPRLPNGKVDLKSLPRIGLHKGLEEDVIGPRNAVERVLADIWSELLQVEMLSVHDNFFELGGDSIVSIQMLSRAREAGLQIEPRHLAEQPTISGLAMMAQQQAPSLDVHSQATGEAGLTPIQHWFLNRNLRVPEHWNQMTLLQCDPRLEVSTLEKAIAYCVDHHDALRARFRLTDEGRWLQTIPEKETSSLLEVVQLACKEDGATDRLIADTQASFDLASGPLVRFVLCRFSSGPPHQLLVVAHHLVVDHISWAILLDDLELTCQQLLERKNVSLPAKTTSLLDWTRRLSEYANSENCRKNIDFWIRTLQGSHNHFSADLPSDSEPEEAAANILTTRLDEEQTAALLKEVNQTYHTDTNEILITALAQALVHRTGKLKVQIDVESHGRELFIDGVDLSRTIGWFTAFYPVAIDLTGVNELSTTIKSVKEQLRQVPNRGVDFGVARYLSQKSTDALSKLPDSNVLFNYLGQDRGGRRPSLFTKLHGAKHSSRHPSNQRSHLLEINALITNGQLSIDWIYSTEAYHHSTIERLSNVFLERLATLIGHCRSTSQREFTPSDFPDVEFSEEDLDEFLKEFD